MLDSSLAITRRGFCATATALIAPPPTGRVSIVRARDYGSGLRPALLRLFDQLGGLGALVRGKTVTIKINLTGSPNDRLGHTPAELAHYTHPALVGATVRLMGEAGARRIRVVEGCYSTAEPLEEFFLRLGWEPRDILNAAPCVEMENTNLLGRGRRYARFMAPGGGLIFPGFDLNHCYGECDAVVSIGKMKEHATCGITLAMKNMFGATPLTIYGDAAGKDEPDEDGAVGGRGAVMHSGRRGPSKSAPQERDPSSPRNDRYRMPRIVVDVVAARPIHIAMIDGIATMTGGEGPWNAGPLRAVRPDLLIAGLNPVCTDAVGAAVMGFDPMATRGAAPFEHCDSFLELAEQCGLGTRDLRRIEVAGLSIREARFPFRLPRFSRVSQES